MAERVSPFTDALRVVVPLTRPVKFTSKTPAPMSEMVAKVPEPPTRLWWNSIPEREGIEVGFALPKESLAIRVARI